MEQPFTATHKRTSDGRITIALAGELDMATAPDALVCVQDAAPEPGCDVLADLSGLSFTDSAGISSLITICKRVRAEGGTFSVTGLQREVRRVLELAGLIDYLNVV